MQIRKLLAAVTVSYVIVACSDSTEPSVATSLEVVAASSQIGTAGKPVPQTPSFVVKDQNGNPMAGAPVSVVVTGGQGVITGSPSVSAAGATPVGTWTLGQKAGPNQLTISSSGLPAVTVTAEGRPGPVALHIPRSQLSIAGRVALPVAPAPVITVADEFQNGVAGAAVTVTVTSGTAPETVIADSAGTATVTDWMLGTEPGVYTLTMTTGGISTVFTADASSGPPATMSVIQGGNQSVLAGSAAGTVRLSVQDSFGNPVAGEQVSFAVTSGGGSLAEEVAQTNVSGVVTMPAWTMGKYDFPQVVRVTADTVVRDVSASIATSFTVHLHLLGSMTPTQEAAFRNAAARVQAMVVGNLSDIGPVDVPLDPCGFSGERFIGSIDDVVIVARIQALGQNILGSAGPCYIRSGEWPNNLPVLGTIRIATDFVGMLEQSGALEEVIVHEMLHVIGFGVSLYWQNTGLLQDPASSVNPGADPQFLGAAARQGCQAAGGGAICATSVPVENTGGPGTWNAHWRESVFATEMMTGFHNSNVVNPLSRISIGGLGDIGYQVNPAAADLYQIPGTGFLGAQIPRFGSRILTDEVLQPVATLERGGRVRPLPQQQPEPQ